MQAQSLNPFATWRLISLQVFLSFFLTLNLFWLLVEIVFMKGRDLPDTFRLLHRTFVYPLGGSSTPLANFNTWCTLFEPLFFILFTMPSSFVSKGVLYCVHYTTPSGPVLLHLFFKLPALILCTHIVYTQIYTIAFKYIPIEGIKKRPGQGSNFFFCLKSSWHPFFYIQF